MHGEARGNESEKCEGEEVDQMQLEGGAVPMKWEDFL